MNFIHASEVYVAVASNFSAPMRQLAAEFQKATGHKALLSFGATGKFYAQIKNAAPFDVLLAADQLIPTRLTQEQFAIAGSQFSYATGKLVLWSAKPDWVDTQGEVLTRGDFTHLAMASPEQAPYGRAAQETLTALKLLTVLSPKIVQGESVGQTWSFVATGNAELGFVALSQVLENRQPKSGSMWIVPQNLYRPLRQDAVLLKHGVANPAALMLLNYLKSNAAKKIIRSYGYQIE